MRTRVSDRWGWDPDARGSVHSPFLERAGDGAAVACVIVDEGDGDAQFPRWEHALRATRPCEPFPVLVPEGSRPYAGFSAGAAVAAERAVVGGWRLDGVRVCREDAGEDPVDDLVAGQR